VKQVDFEHGSVLSNIMQSALPMLVAQLLTLLYSVVDRIYIGRIPGEGTAALGGIGLCFPLILIITAFTNLYGMGGAPLVSMNYGSGHKDRANRIMNTAFVLLVVTGIVLTLGCEGLAKPILVLFGADAENLPYAMMYARIYLLGTVFAMVSTGMNPYVTAQGYSRTAMISVVIGAVMNIVLDPVFIFGMNMGIAGAALATIMSQCASAMYVTMFLRRKDITMRLNILTKEEVRTSGPIAKSIVSLGLSPFIMQFTNGMVSAAANTMLQGYGGAVYVSIMTIVSSVRQLMETPVQAIGEGSSPIISYNYGAARYKTMKTAIKLMAGLSLGYSLLCWLFIEWQPKLLIALFSNDTTLYPKAMSALHIYFYAFVCQGLQYTGQSVFKSLGKRNQAIFFSLFRKAILVVPLTLILPHFFGVNGVFMAEPVSNVVGGGLCFITMWLTIMRGLPDGD